MPKPVKQDRLMGWGRHPVVPARERRSENLLEITREVPLSRGLGRSYGDSSLPASGDTEVASCLLADRILAFDAQTGVLRAEAGLSLSDIYRIFLPRGWFTPVSPGTRFVTVGGMVASDIHGKNHHVDGCFGAHVVSLRVRVADGRVVECSPEKNTDLFRATIGGQGLTGHILEVAFRMVRISSPWIWAESERFDDLDRMLEALEGASHEWPMTVVWADLLASGKAFGRGILTKGRWATPAEAPPRPPPTKGRVTVPFVFPGWILNRWSMRLFNVLVFRKHWTRVRRGVVHPDSFFYPLDVIGAWNRIYGPRGFTQYQAVIPGGRALIRPFLEVLRVKGAYCYFCVVKDCGPEGVGFLSFPKPGISLALDFPVRDNTQAVVDELNEYVIRNNGRVYLAKDAFTKPEHFRAMEPRLAAWEIVRKKWDPHGAFRSAQSVRVLGDSR
jgi:decaprenylphospho-beta-D-ribofuranose 2-oxidase